MLTTLLQLGTVIDNPALTAAGATNALSGLIKLLFVMAGLFYVTFAFILIRQVYVMKNTLITTFSPALIFLGYIHLALAVLVLLFFLLL
jgi:hypothetical protein